MNISPSISFKRNLSFASLLILSSALTPIASQAMDPSENSNNGKHHKKIGEEKNTDQNNHRRNENNNNYNSIPHKKRRDTDNKQEQVDALAILGTFAAQRNDMGVEEKETPSSAKHKATDELSSPVKKKKLNENNAQICNVNEDEAHKRLGMLLDSASDDDALDEENTQKNKPSWKYSSNDFGLDELKTYLEKYGKAIKQATILVPAKGEPNHDPNYFKVIFSTGSTSKEFKVTDDELMKLIKDEAKRETINHVFDAVSKLYKYTTQAKTIKDALIKVALLTNDGSFPENITRYTDEILSQNINDKREKYKIFNKMFNFCKAYEYTDLSDSTDKIKEKSKDVADSKKPLKASDNDNDVNKLQNKKNENAIIIEISDEEDAQNNNMEVMKNQQMTQSQEDSAINLKISTVLNTDKPESQILQKEGEQQHSQALQPNVVQQRRFKIQPILGPLPAQQRTNVCNPPSQQQGQMVQPVLFTPAIVNFENASHPNPGTIQGASQPLFPQHSPKQNSAFTPVQQTDRPQNNDLQRQNKQYYQPMYRQSVPMQQHHLQQYQQRPPEQPRPCRTQQQQEQHALQQLQQKHQHLRLNQQQLIPQPTSQNPYQFTEERKFCFPPRGFSANK